MLILLIFNKSQGFIFPFLYDTFEQFRVLNFNLINYSLYFRYIQLISLFQFCKPISNVIFQ
jgi:hypothetical protein